MSRIGFLSNSVSEGLNNIARAINNMGNDHRSIRIARAASTFTGRRDDLVINWGRGAGNEYLMARVGAGRVLNKTANVALATNKLKSFQAMEDVSTVEWTADAEVAQGWFDADLTVYARTKLQGHSGEGIVVCSNQELGDIGGIETADHLVAAPLYTKGFNTQRREFRIHVMAGIPTYVQQKKRRENWREIEAYSNVVRNFHTGWVYATADVHPNQKALEEALKAIAALGLDFGAVDVITRGENAWVLEVNTAPGNEGTNTTVYAQNFVRILEGQDPLHYTQNRQEGAAAPVEEVDGDLDALAAAALEEVPLIQPHPQDRLFPVEDLPLEEILAPLLVDEHHIEAPLDENTAQVVDHEVVNDVEPVDKKFYFLGINEEETVGQWSRQLDGFLVVGYSMSIPKEDVVIKREIE